MRAGPSKQRGGKIQVGLCVLGCVLPTGTVSNFTLQWIARVSKEATQMFFAGKNTSNQISPKIITWRGGEHTSHKQIQYYCQETTIKNSLVCSLFAFEQNPNALNWIDGGSKTYGHIIGEDISAWRHFEGKTRKIIIRNTQKHLVRIACTDTIPDSILKQHCQVWNACGSIPGFQAAKETARREEKHLTQMHWIRERKNPLRGR